MMDFHHSVASQYIVKAGERVIECFGHSEDAEAYAQKAVDAGYPIQAWWVEPTGPGRGIWHDIDPNVPPSSLPFHRHTCHEQPDGGRMKSERCVPPHDYEFPKISVL